MKILLPLTILLFIILGCSGDPSRQSTKNATQENAPQAPVPANASERLAEAKRILAGKPTDTRELDTADLYLKAIDDKTPEAKEAKLLLVESKKQRGVLEKKLEVATAETKKILRKTAIEKLEKDLLSKGMDFYFTFEGKNEDTLRVKYVLMSRPVVHQITNETDFLSNMATLGVKKVIFTDGYDDTWSYDL